MKHVDAALDLPEAPAPSTDAEKFLALVNRVLMIVAGLALVSAALVLTESVVERYFLHASTEWQDETTVFLLVGATFLSAPFVQQVRAHVGIEALPEILSPRANHFRRIAVDIVSLAFCAFFAWKAWTLFHEAWVDDQHTSSSFGPPLWIPYSMMSLGMSILCLQIITQLAASLRRGSP